MSGFERVKAWWWGRRVPEPEAMEDSAEVEAYACAAAQRHLARLDEQVARRAAALFRGGRLALDLGCGPARIAIAVAGMGPGLFMIGVDLSLPMLRQARACIRQDGVRERLALVCASATALPFRDRCFDRVMSNSLLHHLAQPEQAMREIVRVAASDAVVFLRDLRRPCRLLMPLHLRLFGRHYQGVMRRLFDASVRAAYTPSELRAMARPLRGAKVCRRGCAHLELGQGAAGSGRRGTQWGRRRIAEVERRRGAGEGEGCGRQRAEQGGEILQD